MTFLGVFISFIIVLHYGETKKVGKAPINPHPNSFDVIFENKYGSKVHLYWDDGKDGVLQHEIEHNSKTTINTFETHKFYFTPHNDPKKRLHEVTMKKYVGMVELLDDHKRNNLNDTYLKEKEQFLKEYYQKNGVRWGNHWPREPVRYHYYNITDIGQEINVETNYSQFTICDPNDAQYNEIYSKNYELILNDFEWQRNECSNADDCDENHHKRVKHYTYFDENNNIEWLWQNNSIYCRDLSKPMTVKLQVTCVKPKTVRLFNFLSSDECDAIINTGIKIGLKRSTVGSDAQKTVDRTSSTVWLLREHNLIIDHVIRRIADVVKIDESHLFSNASAEELQLVHYFENELYKPHVDWEPGQNNRYITFLMYLNSPGSGGQTSFPLADKSCKNEDNWFGVTPIKGSAVFFYDLFPDGNTDPLTQHYAEPPTNGSQKWMTNLWIWDPYFRKKLHNNNN